MSSIIKKLELDGKPLQAQYADTGEVYILLGELLVPTNMYVSSESGEMYRFKRCPARHPYIDRRIFSVLGQPDMVEVELEMVLLTPVRTVIISDED